MKVEVSNTDRALGSILGSEITSRYKNGLPEDTITLNCTGAGGQSFGVSSEGLSILSYPETAMITWAKVCQAVRSQ